MTSRREPIVDATERLTGLLDRIGDALVTVDAAALLAAEADLGVAIATVGDTSAVGDHAAVLVAARRASAALLRCRRLGASFSGVARALGRVGRQADGYDRAGSYVQSAGVRSSVQIRA